MNVGDLDYSMTLDNSSSPIAMNELTSWTIWCDTVADGCLILSILQVKKFIKSLLLCCMKLYFFLI